MTALAVGAALGAASLFGLASAVQHREALSVEASVSPRLLLTLARRPWWLAGIVADVLAVGLQAVALSRGSVALVSTLMVAGLPLAVLLSALLARRSLTTVEIRGLLLCSAGLAVLGPALATTALGRAPSRSSGLLAALVVAAVVLPLLALRHRPRYGGMLAGAAAGAVVGAGAVLLAVTATRVQDGLSPGLALLGAVAVGLLGLLLTQVAFQTGELGAPLAALTVVEPVVAVLLAVAVLGEALPGGAGHVAALAVGSLAAVTGVLVLSRA